MIRKFYTYFTRTAVQKADQDARDLRAAQDAQEAKAAKAAESVKAAKAAKAAEAAAVTDEIASLLRQVEAVENWDHMTEAYRWLDVGYQQVQQRVVEKLSAQCLIQLAKEDYQIAINELRRRRIPFDRPSGRRFIGKDGSISSDPPERGWW